MDCPNDTAAPSITMKPVHVMCSLADLACSPRHQHLPVCLYQDQIVTHAQWQDRVAHWCAQLQQQSEQRWLLYARDTFLFSVGLFALLHAGKEILLPANIQSGTLEHLAPHIDAALVDVAIPESVPALHLQHDVPSTRSIQLAPLNLSNARVVLSTSGTTGVPKHINKPLAWLDAEVQVLEQLWGNTLSDASVVAATVSHQHIYGLLFRLLWPMCAGRAFLVKEIEYPEELYTYARTFTSMVLIGSPAHLKRWPLDNEFAQAAKSMTRVFSSGGPLAKESALQWSAYPGMAPIEVLGSTETGGVAWRQRSVDQPEPPWTPLPGVETNVSNAAGSLQIRSPFQGNEWVVMGDNVSPLPDGRFYLLGRSDRIVKIEEKRVSLTEVEQHFLKLNIIKEVAVLALETSGRQQLAVVVVLNEAGKKQLLQSGVPAMNQQLRNWAGKILEPVTLPRRFRYPDEMPFDERGKSTLNLLQELFTRHDN